MNPETSKCKVVYNCLEKITQIQRRQYVSNPEVSSCVEIVIKLGLPHRNTGFSSLDIFYRYHPSDAQRINKSIAGQNGCHLWKMSY